MSGQHRQQAAEDTDRHEQHAPARGCAGFFLVAFGQLSLDHLARPGAAEEADGERVKRDRDGKGDQRRQ